MRLFFLTAILISCSDQIVDENDPHSIVSSGVTTNTTLTSPPTEQEKYNLSVQVYNYGGRKDSTLNCTYYFNNNKCLDRKGSCYYNIPFENEILTENLFEIGQNVEVHETFDSLTCEVGGNAAYDRYKFTTDKQNRVIEVAHFMAWYERYKDDGEFYTDDTPDYFPGHMLKVEYGENSRTIKTFDDEKNLMEVHINRYHENGNLRDQVWQLFGINEQVYKAFYTYND